MKVIEVRGIECPHCNEFIQASDLGIKKVELAVETRYQCGECDTVYIDETEAQECCKE